MERIDAYVAYPHYDALAGVGGSGGGAVLDRCGVEIGLRHVKGRGDGAFMPCASPSASRFGIGKETQQDVAAPTQYLDSRVFQGVSLGFITHLYDSGREGSLPFFPMKGIRKEGYR